MSHEPHDPLPLTPQQLRVLVACAARQLASGQRASSRILAAWRARAATIPDGALRSAALTALATKRGHADGAALFSVLAPPSRDLLDVLLAYEIVWDYLDSVHEPAPDEANGRQLHLALLDALDPERPRSDYYRYSPWCDDGGYLDALVETCRRGISALPSYAAVWPLLRSHAVRTDVLALNHLRDAAERDSALHHWAAVHFPDESRLAWFELSGAASASLVPHALLALAANRDVEPATVQTVEAAYWPWISLATTMLDSYVDQFEDAALGNHSYVGHYITGAVAAERIAECLAESASRAVALPLGHRHAVIVASMAAMYLSKDSAWSADLRPTTRRLLRSGGSLTQALAPVLRAWRVYYGHRAA